VGEKGLLLVNDSAESTALAWARDDPHKAFFRSHDGALRDYTAAVVVSVGWVAYYIEYLELLSLPCLWVGDVDEVGSDDLYLLDACAAANLLELLFAFYRLDGVPTNFEDAVSPVGFLLATRRLTLSECIAPDRVLLLLVEYELL
jgi:hypothetical protein